MDVGKLEEGALYSLLMIKKWYCWWLRNPAVAPRHVFDSDDLLDLFWSSFCLFEGDIFWFWQNVSLNAIHIVSPCSTYTSPKCFLLLDTIRSFWDVLIPSNNNARKLTSKPPFTAEIFFGWPRAAQACAVHDDNDEAGRVNGRSHTAETTTFLGSFTLDSWLENGPGLKMYCISY